MTLYMQIFSKALCLTIAIRKLESLFSPNLRLSKYSGYCFANMDKVLNQYDAYKFLQGIGTNQLL